MSIHERMSTKTQKRTWEVRYRQGSRNRSRTFHTEREARVFDGEVARLVYHGTVDDLHAGSISLDDFVEVWWENEAKRKLAANTLAGYANAYNNHIFPYLGGEQLKSITPRAVEEWRSDLEDSGVGVPTIRTAMIVLQSCLTRAVVYGEISSNPVKEVRKPTRERKQAVEPFTPLQIEKIRRNLIDRQRHRDATFVSVLAYAGLRPGEARGLEWRHIRKNTILVEQSFSKEDVKSTKTGKSRSVMLLAALRYDLEWWRAYCGDPTEGFVFQGPTPGEPWAQEAYKSWNRKGFLVALNAAGISEGRPYDMRHSFASLLLHSGRSVVDAAAQLGHSPTMNLTTYAHVINDLDGDYRPIGELIAEARLEVHGFVEGEPGPGVRKTPSSDQGENGSTEPIAMGSRTQNNAKGPESVRRGSQEAPRRPKKVKGLRP